MSFVAHLVPTPRLARAVDLTVSRFRPMCDTPAMHASSDVGTLVRFRDSWFQAMVEIVTVHGLPLSWNRHEENDG